MHLQPYLYFNGRCEEAINFYKTALGAKVNMMMRFRECPPSQEMKMQPGVEEKVMHASVKIGDTDVLMSDGRCGGETKFDGFAVSISASSDVEAERIFAAISDGGKVSMPMNSTFFASRFGMANDRFGVAWMVLKQK